MKKTKRESGQLGGLATLARHGKTHFQHIGRRGALTTWQRYKLEPAGLSDFAMTNRKTGEVKAVLSGRWKP